MPDEPTPKQRAYLDFIRDYTALHRQPPSERDMGIHFRDAPPEVHRVVVALTAKGLIARAPGQARSIRVITGTGEPAARTATPAPRPSDDIREPLDAEIAPLVVALRAKGVVTLASCAGHGKAPAFIDLAVDGLDGLRAFVDRVNLLDRGVRDQASFDIALNWRHEDVTACAFNRFPSWIMLSWQIRGAGPDGAASAALLSLIAKRWSAARPRMPKRV